MLSYLALSRGLCVCNGKMVSCSDDGSIMVWSPGTWTCARSMEGHDGAANAVVECRGRLASAGDDGVIKLWGIGSWACEVTVHHTSVDARDEESSQVQCSVVLCSAVWCGAVQGSTM
jgi:WD40 repeat protein